jgi:hypothetical protein
MLVLGRYADLLHIAYGMLMLQIRFGELPRPFSSPCRS